MTVGREATVTYFRHGCQTVKIAGLKESQTGRSSSYVYWGKGGGGDILGGWRTRVCLVLCFVSQFCWCVSVWLGCLVGFASLIGLLIIMLVSTTG